MLPTFQARARQAWGKAGPHAAAHAHNELSFPLLVVAAGARRSLRWAGGPRADKLRDEWQ
jgi:hypothetical protein